MARTKLPSNQFVADHGVSGTKPVADRKSWQQMVKEGVKVVFLKKHKRFARGVVAQELGLQFCEENGITVVPLSDPDLFKSKTRAAKMARQIRAVVDEASKKEACGNMAAGRAKKRKENEVSKKYLALDKKGKCEGRKTLLQMHGEKLARAVRCILKKPYPKRQAKNSNAIISWNQLKSKLLKKGFATTRMTSQDGSVRPAGRPLAKNSLATLLRDMQQRRL